MSLNRIVSFSDLESLRRWLQGKTVVLGTGCFDLLHVGHLYFLRDAAKQGDVLFIGINSDRAVRTIKGETRPIIRQDERAELMAAFRYVDFVFIYDDVTADKCILNLKPDVFAIGEKSVKAYPEELTAAKRAGARVHVVKCVPSISTTSVVKTILNENTSS